MNLTTLSKELDGQPLAECLKIISSHFGGKTIFTTSFGIEDQAITHMICENDLNIETATIDTGRLFSETYKVHNETLKKYKKEIKVYFPDHRLVEKMVTEKGPFSFYYSVENRHECCSIRKVEPLKRALENMECWISGIRSDQSDSRGRMKWLHYDDEKKIVKFYPLFNWSFNDVKKYIRDNNIPYNVLHDKGYVSIGCEPCTRAVKEGEDFRAGRWWWERGSEKECGLHVK